MSSPVLPRWARAADYLTILLLAVALVIAASGGVRIREPWRIQITSPYRVIFWAAIVALVRHVISRDQPIYRHLPADFVRWFRSTPVRAASTTFLGTRPAIYFVGYLAVFVIGYAPNANMTVLREFDNELLNLPLRWDTNWYLGIAINGYRYLPSAGPETQQNIVFFPAYPVAVRVLALLFGGSPRAHLPFVLAGTLVSLMAFLGALVYLYLLARDQLGDDESRAALWLLSAYPFALFFGAIYTESFFLLGTIGTFYHLRHRQFVRAGLWGLLVGLTRPNGFFLTAPLAILALLPWLPYDLTLGRRSSDDEEAQARERRFSSAWPAFVVAAMPLAGMLIYSAFIWNLTGRPFAWAEGHAAWGRSYKGLAVIVTDRFNYITNAGLYAYVRDVPLDFLNAIGVIFVLISVWPVWRTLGLAYAVFILINLLPPLAQGGLLSSGRFTSVLFPSFIWLASAVPARHFPGWMATFAANQALNASLFYTWRQLY